MALCIFQLYETSRYFTVFVYMSIDRRLFLAALICSTGAVKRILQKLFPCIFVPDVRQLGLGKNYFNAVGSFILSCFKERIAIMAVAHVELYKAFGQHGNESFLCCLFF